MACAEVDKAKFDQYDKRKIAGDGEKIFTTMALEKTKAGKFLNLLPSAAGWLWTDEGLKKKALVKYFEVFEGYFAFH